MFVYVFYRFWFALIGQILTARTAGSRGGVLAVVTLQAFTRGKSFYLGKISPGKFTSGFIFPGLKGHTGDHDMGLWDEISARVFKILAQKWKTCSRIKRIKERFLFLFHCCSLLYFKEQDEQE